MLKFSGEYLETSNELFLEHLTIEKIFSICKAKGFACAIYRLPDSYTKISSDGSSKSKRHIIIDLDSGQDLNHLELDEMGNGFIFHPFSANDHKIKFINRDIHIVEDLTTAELELIHTNISVDEFQKIFDIELPDNASTDALKALPAGMDSNSDEKEKFISKIETAITEIQKNSFQKVVLSRIKKIDLPDGFDAFGFFDALASHYNNAFVYLSFIPKVGTWLGATPETLINIDQNNQFQTIALAATQSYKDGVTLEDTTWSQKDIEEQAMVSRYIINCFKKIRLREFEEIGPRTHLSGNLIHLKTDYKVDMDQVAFPQLGSVMLQLLHPTSAVCGMPKEAAQNFISNNEDFDRTYFSGFLGPVNILEETNIYVNLRCMQVLDASAKLFAGAGIISNSNSEKEWNETEIKMETLLKVLRKMYR